MGISFIGLGVSLTVIVIIAVVIYFCCCRKNKSSHADDQVISPAGQANRSDNLIGNGDGPVCFLLVFLVIEFSVLKSASLVFMLLVHLFSSGSLLSIKATTNPEAL